MVNSRCSVKGTFSLMLRRFVLSHRSSYCGALREPEELFAIEFPATMLSLSYNSGLLSVIALSLWVRTKPGIV